ncbi:hypothetical protein [Streptomyces sp. NBC_00258]|uniref:hypothetical protein n=1 Tax=Streptomyces sp. NBC_00258 TaxID=2903642 RepID=UPI002E2B4B9E|nr:hypothetical protein [Streptomyces sp. NBC_00258]
MTGGREPIQTAGVPGQRCVAQRDDLLPGLVRQIRKCEAQHGPCARGQHLAVFVFLAPVLAQQVPPAPAGAVPQAFPDSVGGFLGGGERGVDDQQVIGERFGTEQGGGFREDGGAGAVGGGVGKDHGELVVGQPVDDAGGQTGDDPGVVPGRGDVQVVDDQDAGGHVDEVLELRAELAVLIE